MADLGARFLLVSFTWNETPKVAELVPLFDSALDWMRYASNSWVLWTTSAPDVWLKHILPHLGKTDFVLICELNLSDTPDNYTGWNSKIIWDWIQKHRT
jgi:hypothetical protein